MRCWRSRATCACLMSSSTPSSLPTMTTRLAASVTTSDRLVRWVHHSKMRPTTGTCCSLISTARRRCQELRWPRQASAAGVPMGTRPCLMTFSRPPCCLKSMGTGRRVLCQSTTGLTLRTWLTSQRKLELLGSRQAVPWPLMMMTRLTTPWMKLSSKAKCSGIVSRLCPHIQTFTTTRRRSPTRERGSRF